ncbi:nuclear pore complex protein Nup160-like [Babylonia areolata]|uniref:nuclear pore complex protein Nup160-like n=1 Tax=Babylonia areolata TaxID=304850 RepID=UPI003FD01335
MAAPGREAEGMMREVVVAQSVAPPWKEIVVNTGASASTLQDIKVPDSCGGYTYRDSSRPGSPVRNRFIYWRTWGDILELEESSLDMLLTGGRIRYRLQDTPIVGGVSVSETSSHVVVLVATVASIHRLVFPHPCRRLQTETFSLSEHISTSIFFDASLGTATDSKNLHLLNPGGSITAHLVSAASCLNGEGEALFALGTNAGTILLLKMPPVGITGVVIQHELSHSSVMQKLWSGLVPGAIRGHQQASDTAVSVEIQPLRGETYIFALCRDLRLRVWTTKTRECLLTVNLQDMLGGAARSQPSATGHIIKQVQSSAMAALMFCVYLSFPDRSQFLLLEPVVRDGRLSVMQHALLTQPAEDLIDFCVTANQLITLWTDSSGETIARAAVLTEGGPTGEWQAVLLEPPYTSEPYIPSNRDPRDFYLDLIFRPNNFSHHDIIRALTVYRRSHDSTQTADALLMSINIREEVTNAVNQEIMNCAAENEMLEETYYQLQLEQWGRFYSCCCQYREVGAKLQGVFTDSSTGLVCLIRKATLTYLRPCDRLERLYLCEQERVTPTDLDDLGFQVDGVSQYALCEDMRKLCDVVQLVGSEVTEDVAAQFLQELVMMEPPRELADRLVDTVFFEDVDMPSEVGAQIEVRLQTVHQLTSCLDLLQVMMDLQDTQQLHQSLMDDSVGDATRQLRCSHLFTSPEASAILSRCFEQVCMTRISLLRDLIIVQVLALRLRHRRGVSPEVRQTIEEELLPTFSQLLRSYMLLHWSSQALTTISPTSSLDSNVRRLASLELNDCGGFTAVRQTSSPVTVLESFIQAIGGTQARQQIAMVTEQDSQATWSHDLMAFVHSLAALIWPLSDETLFPEFLAGSCQYSALQEYVRLLQPWCMWNSSSAVFFLGLSHLYFNEPHKAQQCFISASDGVATETFLTQKLLQGHGGSHRQMTLDYYLKVIVQFEEYGMPDMVIALANHALRLADPEDPNVATLQSKVFKYQLELGHHQEAYTAMMNNPDPARRRDCLRQFVVVLCETGELQDLVQVPYHDLEEEVVAVLERRARSVDLASYNYYNVLYSFHIYRNNLRKAASVMYEHGVRLGREMAGVRALQRQAQCYLVTMNVLRLVQPDYAWIVQPSLQAPQVSVTERDSGDSPSKHTVDGKEKQPATGKKKVQIVELKQLEKEYLLLNARLRLIHKNPEPSLASGPTPGADEMVGILVNNGLYDMAVVVCQAFGLPLFPIFTSLSLRCVNLARCSSYMMLGDNKETSEAWDWLRENDIHAAAQSTDNSATDHAWKLLQRYLECFEESDARYHRCVCEKLLSQAFPLPAWLVNSYKVLSTPQLLRVYLDYDLLQPAAMLLMEYLEALMGVLQGQDAPVFGLKGLLDHNLMSVWVPYTCADQLLGALGQHREDHTHIQLHEELLEKISTYHHKVSRLSVLS